MSVKQLQWVTLNVAIRHSSYRKQHVTGMANICQWIERSNAMLAKMPAKLLHSSRTIQDLLNSCILKTVNGQQHTNLLHIYKVCHAFSCRWFPDSFSLAHVTRDRVATEDSVSRVAGVPMHMLFLYLHQKNHDCYTVVSCCIWQTLKVKQVYFHSATFNAEHSLLHRYLSLYLSVGWSDVSK